MKKFLFLFLTVVFYSVNTTVSQAQNEIVPIMDRFVVNVKWGSVNSNYGLARIYVTIKNLTTGVTYRASGSDYTQKYDGVIEYTLKTNKTFNNISSDDRFEIITGIESLNGYIRYQVTYAGISQPQLIERNSKSYCNVDGNTLSGITRSPIPITTLYLVNGVYY